MIAARHTRKRALGLVALALAMGGQSARGFDEFPIGARPSSLGGAFTGLADDIHALYYNPAGMGILYRPEVTAYYARLFPNLSDQTRTALTFLAAGAPLPGDGRWGGVGVGYQEFKVDDLFKERAMTLAYGRTFLSDRLALGLGMKSLNRMFGDGNAPDNPALGTSTVDPVFAGGNSASALGVDLGGLFALTSTVKMGLSILNVNRPDLGLVQDNRLPLVTRLGASYSTGRLKAAMDLSRSEFLNDNVDTRLHMGAERLWLFRQYGVLGVRAGGAFGSRDFRQATLGAGYEVNGLGFDYVFTIPLGAADDTGTMHNFSLSYKFGRAPTEDELELMILREKEATARAEEALKLAEAEAVFVREERNKLLSQYATEMERMKAELENARKATVKPAAVATRVLTPEERERLARDKARRQFAAAYEAGFRAYSVQVERGASLAKRIELLGALIKKYEDKGLDVSRAKNEQERVKSELAQVSTDYRITLDFYKKTVTQGADVAERISLLERMVKKYQRSGIDISEVTKELAKLKSQ